ncbi:MAG: L,D-transpeptidase family protein [Nitrospirota bacterium]
MLSAAFAVVHLYGEGETVIGNVQTYKVKDRDSLIEMARKFQLGYNEIVDANPDLNPFVPGAGVSVKIPTLWILPNVISYEGIVINLSEMRLYYFFKKKGSRFVVTFPIGIGAEGNDTPVGNFRVTEKIVRPSWHVPESIRKEKPQLPKVLPPGPDNPLGSYAIRLSFGNILIHGTNKPWGVGRRVSHGCIRLYPEDIPKLFQLVPNGAKVTIVRQPVKVGIKNNKVYIEVHKDDYIKNYFNEVVSLLRKKGLLSSISTEKLYKALREKSGIPVEISN